MQSCTSLLSLQCGVQRRTEDVVAELSIRVNKRPAIRPQLHGLAVRGKLRQIPLACIMLEQASAP